MRRWHARPILRRSVVGWLGAALGAGGLVHNRPARAAGILKRTDLSWAIFYGETLEAGALAGLDLAVLDPGFKGPVDALANPGTEILGYLSLGEIRRSSALFPQLADPDVLIGENAQWPDTVACDVRRPAWRSLILDVAIPALLERGFSGLFFDTLDTPPYLEQTDPDRYGGMRAAAIDLVHAIRERFPARTLLMNRGYALLPELRSKIDGVVAESLLTTYDAATNGYRWIDETERDQHMQALRPLLDDSGGVPILSLDYWDPDDLSALREIYARERALGHRPYVAERLLDRIVREPVSLVGR